mgnify:CR=1 FL=1
MTKLQKLNIHKTRIKKKNRIQEGRWDGSNGR